MLLSIFGLGIFAQPFDDPHDPDVLPSSDSQDPPLPEFPELSKDDLGHGYYQYADMILDDTQDRLHRGLDTEADRNAVIGDKYRWPGGVIPYKFDDSTVNEEMKKRVKGYVAKFNIQASGCLQIR